jgi:bacterial/archaeal transporter family protein
MGVLFAILSPAFFGINNYIEKLLLDKNKISITVLIIFEGIFSLITGLIILLIIGLYPIDIKSLFIFLFSGFLTTMYMLPYFKALTLDETSYVIPLFQFYPIFVLILSFVFLHEIFSVIQYLGCLIIIFAGFILSTEKFSISKFKIRKSFYYMILSCFLFALAQVLYKFGVQEVPFLNTLPYEGFGIALGTLAVVLYKRALIKKFKRETSRFKPRIFVFLTINQLVYLVARYTGYFAISLIAVGMVSILAGFQSVFVLFYGIMLSLWLPYILKEVINKKVLFKKIISIVLMFLGLYLIFS